MKATGAAVSKGGAAAVAGSAAAAAKAIRNRLLRFMVETYP